MPTGGQAGRWQAIADTTTIGSSLVDLKEKGLRHRTDVFVCRLYKESHSSLGVSG